MNVNWTRRIFANGRGWHVGDMVHWNGAWHIAFCDGSGHNSPDTQCAVLSSTDLENWSCRVAISQEAAGGYVAEPQLLVSDGRLLMYAGAADTQAVMAGGTGRPLLDADGRHQGRGNLEQAEAVLRREPRLLAPGRAQRPLLPHRGQRRPGAAGSRRQGRPADLRGRRAVGVGFGDHPGVGGRGSRPCGRRRRRTVRDPLSLGSRPPLSRRRAPAGHRARPRTLRGAGHVIPSLPRVGVPPQPGVALLRGRRHPGGRPDRRHRSQLRQRGGSAPSPASSASRDWRPGYSSTTPTAAT